MLYSSFSILFYLLFTSLLLLTISFSEEPTFFKVFEVFLIFNKKKTARQYLTVHRYQLPPPPPENPPPEKPDEENPPPPGVVEPVELNTAVE